MRELFVVAHINTAVLPLLSYAAAVLKPTATMDQAAGKR
jgi:hypothetical protein